MTNEKNNNNKTFIYQMQWTSNQFASYISTCIL